jgi:hypothetical protein
VNIEGDNTVSGFDLFSALFRKIWPKFCHGSVRLPFLIACVTKTIFAFFEKIKSLDPWMDAKLNSMAHL